MMEPNKITSLLLAAVFVIAMSGCNTTSHIEGFVDAAIENDEDALASPVIHEVYNYEGPADAKVISVFNTVGNIAVTHAEDSQVHVLVNLVQTKAIRDLDIKLSSLRIEPQTTNDVLFYEPLAGDGKTNYWNWIDDH
ncbi:MAG: hypothetical protein LUG13_01615 [Oscillospiraceae bacterium]|nr:hypothetical protein [Oscillospiraceae bacterium]